MAVLITATIYFAAVFAFAFAMGVARTLIIAPLLGATAAIMLELPFVLAVSWVVAHRLLRDRPFDLAQRVGMGGIAFSLLMASEAALAGALRAQTVAAWALELATPLGLLGLAGQLGFAAMPAFAGRDGGHRT